jgi:protein phosphatase
VVIPVPTPCVVALVGPPGSGKSTFAQRHFAPAAIFSSDAWRQSISGQAADQSASREAFEALYRAAAGRLAEGGTAVVDATNLDIEARGRCLDLAAAAGCPAIAVVFDMPLEQCLAWNAARPERRVAPGVVRRQHRALQRTLPTLRHEGFDALFLIADPDELDRTVIEQGAAVGARSRSRGPA